MKQRLLVLTFILVLLVLVLVGQGYSQEISGEVPIQSEVQSTEAVPISQEGEAVLDTELKKGIEAKQEVGKLGQKYETNFFTLILKVIFSLAIIGVLIYLVVRFFFKSQRWMGQGGDFMQLIATQALSPNKCIQLVELGDRLLVLGISDHNINLLTQITEKETIDLIKTQASKEAGLKGFTFSQLLKGRWKGPEETPDSNYGEKVEFLKEQRQRLRNLDLGR